MPMTYTGTRLKWEGVGEWNASSGITEGGEDYRNSKYQHLSDKGPIPEGTYDVPLQMGTNAKVIDKKGSLDKKLQIQSLQCIANPEDKSTVLIYENWGSNRVRLRTQRITNAKAKHRGGFYIHDSTKGYSHGCIEVDTAFFDAIRQYSIQNSKKQKFVRLTVNYGPNAKTGVSTNGGTKKMSTEVKVHCG